MTCYDAYIGDLEDPGFLWEGGEWNGNMPRRLGPLFPSIDHASLSRFIEWAEGEGCVFRQADWGCHIARVDKRQLLNFMDFFYGPPPDGKKAGGRASHVREFIESLDDEKVYGLVHLES